MPREDINQKEFDEATITKLEIFEKYLEEWLPVFLKQEWVRRVLICDFFAGSGQDINGEPGSPLRILRTIEKFKDLIISHNKEILVLFNDKKSKIKTLFQSVYSTYPDIREMYNGLVSIEYKQEEFESLFYEYEERFTNQPNLLFFDQYGATKVNNSIFQKLILIERTDFLFFISSSFVYRFGKEAGFSEIFNGSNAEIIRENKFSDCHRTVLEYYRKMIPSGNKTQLYPFSLKKRASIHGLIFGTKSPLGVEKFLKVVWKENNINGEANFDIDNDISKRQGDLFAEKFTKMDLFDINIESYIKERGMVSNRELFYYALENGHLPSHAKKQISALRKAGKITCDINVGCSYDSCEGKNKKIKEIKWVGDK